MQARISNTSPSGKIRNHTPISRISNFQTTRSGDVKIAAGMPIGLLLVLTYAQSLVDLAQFGERPNVRIA